MTTAHRPTFDPARGKEERKGPAYHQRLLPAHTQLKVRQTGQGGTADVQRRDLRAELLKAEAAHFAKTRGTINQSGAGDDDDDVSSDGRSETKQIEDETPEAKRRRILEETRDLDADSASEEDGSSSSDSSDDEDDEDDTAQLMLELEKIKKERAEAKEREEREKAVEEEEQREIDIARGNPLLNAQKDFGIKRRWDDDVIFKNQARGGDDKNKKKEFVNDLLRSDFHKRFMSKYVR